MTKQIRTRNEETGDDQVLATLAASSFFHVRFGALMTRPFLMALAATRIYRTSPFTTALTRWRLGKKRRLVMAVICVPIPPLFLDLPLRQMMLPFIGPLPVNSQILAIRILSRIKEL